MTLIELLVVIVIITTLVAAAIPLMAPSTSERQLREASRGLNAFLQAAQARAVAHGRPFGVALKRLSQNTGRGTPGDPLNDNGVAVEAFVVEQQPPYSGFDPSSLARVAMEPRGTGLVYIQFVRATSPDATPGDQLPPGFDADPFPPGLLRPGDIVEMRGTRFEFLLGTNAIDAQGFFAPAVGSAVPERFTVRPLNATGQLMGPVHDDAGNRIMDIPSTAWIGPHFWTAPAAYKVLRQPVPTSDEPYQLPEGTVVDLRASGIGDSTFFHWPSTSAMGPSSAVDNSDGIIIMFAPEGRVSQVLFNRAPGGCTGCSQVPVVENIYLLVGPNVPPPPTPAADKTLTSTAWDTVQTDADRQAVRSPLNWLRGDSAWIVIGSTSGRIATIENAFVDPLLVLNPPLGEIRPFGAATQPSEEMRSNQIVKARQLTREMSQLGGR